MNKSSNSQIHSLLIIQSSIHKSLKILRTSLLQYPRILKPRSKNKTTSFNTKSNTILTPILLITSTHLNLNIINLILTPTKLRKMVLSNFSPYLIILSSHRMHPQIVRFYLDIDMTTNRVHIKETILLFIRVLKQYLESMSFIFLYHILVILIRFQNQMLFIFNFFYKQQFKIKFFFANLTLK